jgi:hypothetical protein
MSKFQLIAYYDINYMSPFLTKNGSPIVCFHPSHEFCIIMTLEHNEFTLLYLFLKKINKLIEFIFMLLYYPLKLGSKSISIVCYHINAYTLS